MSTKNIVKKRILDIDYERNKLSWFFYIPLLLIAGFVPLIVYGKYINLAGTTQALFWTGQNELLDFFSYWKSRWIIFLTATALIIYIFLYISKKLPFKKEYKYYIPLSIYSFFVILSTVFAIDLPTALNGFVEMYQSVWILLSYVLITFLIINYVNSKRDVILFLYAFIFLIIVEGTIGVGQYFGFDIFNTKFGNSLIIPGGVNLDGGLTFNFGKHTIYGTLFNTNYVGSFATLMLPMAVVFLLTSKTTKKRIIAFIALILCLFTWIGCNSRAGYLGAFVAACFIIFLKRKLIMKHWKVAIYVLGSGIIMLFILNYASNGRVIYQISNLNFFKVLEQSKLSFEEKGMIKYESIEIDKDEVRLKTSAQNFIVKVENEKLYLLGDNGDEMPISTTDDGEIYIPLPNKQYFTVTIPKNYPGFTINTPPWRSCGSLNFYISEDGIKMIGNGNRIVEPIEAKSSKLFKGIESFASGRGYIWNRTIPLLNKYFIFGAGPDNYVIAFPQDDFIARLNNDTPATLVIDKPHNMYLQIAINTGVMSLIALLVLWSIYVFSSIKLYWKIDLDSMDKYMGIACLLSVIGYLISGIFNDSMVSVAPIFWIIFGLGISINIRLKRKEETNV